MLALFTIALGTYIPVMSANEDVMKIAKELIERELRRKDLTITTATRFK